LAMYLMNSGARIASTRRCRSDRKGELSYTDEKEQN
jgi:hypothetical protein